MAMHVIGRVTVVSAGTRVQVQSTSKNVAWISFQAESGNSGVIYVGDSTVSSTKYMAALDAKASVFIPNLGVPGPYNLSDFYVDSSGSSQNVQVAYGGQ